MMRCLCEPCGCCPQLTREKKKRNTTHVFFVCVVSGVFVMKGSHSTFPSSTQTQVHTLEDVPGTKRNSTRIVSAQSLPLLSPPLLISHTPSSPPPSPPLFFFLVNASLISCQCTGGVYLSPCGNIPCDSVNKSQFKIHLF